MIDFSVQVNKKDKDWLYAKSFEVAEDDEQPQRAGACLVHIENGEAAIYMIAFFNKHKNEFMEKLESFLKTFYIKKISIGLLKEGIEFTKIQFLESLGYELFDCFLTKDFDKNIHIYEKYLDYETPWNDIMFLENYVDYNKAILETPDGYRLPTIKDIEVFKKLYKVESRFDKIVITDSKGTQYSINKEKFVNKGYYAVYPNSCCFWIESENTGSFATACLCENKADPMIVPRGRFLNIIAIYIKK